MAGTNRYFHKHGGSLLYSFYHILHKDFSIWCVGWKWFFFLVLICFLLISNTKQTLNSECIYNSSSLNACSGMYVFHGFVWSVFFLLTWINILHFVDTKALLYMLQLYLIFWFTFVLRGESATKNFCFILKFKNAIHSHSSKNLNMY